MLPCRPPLPECRDHCPHPGQAFSLQQDRSHLALPLPSLYPLSAGAQGRLLFPPARPFPLGTVLP